MPVSLKQTPSAKKSSSDARVCLIGEVGAQGAELPKPGPCQLQQHRQGAQSLRAFVCISYILSS
jgi:hypothetical protein